MTEHATLDAPGDMLADHPETAYFWGRVVGDGELARDCVTVRTNDEHAADALAAIAGHDRVDLDHNVTERDYAHDATVTRCEDEYVVQVFGGLADRAAAAFGLPIDGAPGGYRLDAVGHRRQLLRGILEGCGTVCAKDDGVGVSFVHDDRALLDRVDALLDAVPPETPTGAVDETSSGGYWFSVEDAAVPALGRWLYEGSDDTGLYAPTRRRKLLGAIDHRGA